jgi:hypothetical protein
VRECTPRVCACVCRPSWGAHPPLPRCSNPRHHPRTWARLHQVRVFRLVTEGTVEEKIVERADRKLYLDAAVIQQVCACVRARACVCVCVPACTYVCVCTLYGCVCLSLPALVCVCVSLSTHSPTSTSHPIHR